MDTAKTITHLSLCSGYSGIGMGLKGVFPTLREIAHVEIEAYAIANLVAKMEESKLPPAPIFTNLKTFPFSSFRGCVDILSGGFPCQPFSNAGKRKASEDPRHLFPYIKRGIAACRPRLVFLENVEGIISAKMPNGQSVLKYVLSELEGVGYKATAGVFSAAEIGASHQRKRIFILGVADSCIDERRNLCGQKPKSKLTRVSYNGGSAMADTEREQDNREWGSSEQGRNEMGRNTEATQREDRRASAKCADGLSKAMADTDNARPQRNECAGGTNAEGRQEQTRHATKFGTIPIARPGEEQFPREEPRTKPKLGRTTNGASNRVDRLRACGNGVVPATAEKAFRTLISRLI